MKLSKLLLSEDEKAGTYAFLAERYSGIGKGGGASDRLFHWVRDTEGDYSLPIDLRHTLKWVAAEMSMDLCDRMAKDGQTILSKLSRVGL